jgi:SAM-dependent methyltransferase
MSRSTNLWSDSEHALGYLRARDTIPHRVDALAVVCELLPARVERVLDLGTGAGDLLALVLAARPGASGVGLDFGDEMLRQARARFASNGDVEIRHHDLERPLPDDLGDFDVIASSFAIHHLAPARQRALYGEAFNFSNETQITVLEITRRILALMGSDLEPEVRNEAGNEIQHQYLSARKAREVLGWSPLFDLERGLARTIDWYREFFADVNLYC